MLLLWQDTLLSAPARLYWLVMTGPLLLHSVSYSGSWGQVALPLDQFVDKAADLGFGGVMLMAKRPHLSVLDYSEKERTRLRMRLEQRGLTGIVVAGYTNFTADLEHAEVPHREFQIQHVTELARLASDLGGSLVRIFSGYEHPAAPYSRQWSIVVDSLRECARRAAELGVTVGVQNHHDLAAGWEAMLDLIRDVGEPNCRPMFDAWAPALQGADLWSAAAAFGAITPHTTIANYLIRPRYRYEPALVHYTTQTPTTLAVPVDEGFINYKAFLGAMAEAGFRGSVAYEMCSPLRDGGTMEVLDRYARRFVEFMAGAIA
jgi:sugar phosphate isomerase/epimerase